jgi:EmrB/QacA subfamily drug resistance transporter
VSERSSSGRWVLAASILGSSMAFIDGSVVNIALPVLQTRLGTTTAAAQWVVEAYSLALSSLVLTGGTLADRFGRRRIFSAGTLLFAAASLACALSPSVAWLIAARAVQGIGGSLLVPASLALIGAAFGERERGRAVGLWSALTSVTMAIGPALGGWLVEAISWRAVFFVNLPIAAAVLAIAAAKIPETRNEKAGRLDWPGSVLATLGLGGLVFGLIEAPAAGWHSARTLVPVAAGVAALAAFVVVERRSREPMVPPSLFRSRTFTAANLLTFFLYAGLAAVLFYLPFALIQARGYSPAAAGASILPLVVLVSALSRPAGMLADRIGPRLPLTLGPFVAAAGYAVLAFGRGDASYAASVLPGLSLVGLGLAICVAPLTATVLNAVGREHSGTASGISNAVARVAALLAIAVFGIANAAAFNRALDRRLDAARVSDSVRRDLDAERPKLGAMRPPPGAGSAEADAVTQAVKGALDAAFRDVALGSAAVSVLAGACAAWGVRRERKRR